MPTTSYWLAQPLPPVPAHATSDPVDVVVVGGGVTGCSCALTLARRGVRVRLLEADGIASGASGRNGGFALRGGAFPYDEACSRLGRDRARLLWRLSEAALDRLERLAGDAFRRIGSLRLAADASEQDALRAEYDALRRDGFAVEWVDRLEPPLDGLYVAALHHPTDGSLDPARWVRRLAAEAVAAGAELAEGRRVDLAEAHRFAREAVVVAVDGLTAAVLPELAPFVTAVRGQVLSTEPEAIRYRQPHYAREGYDYWQQLPDGRLVLGGCRDAGFDEERTGVDGTTLTIQARLDDLAAALLGKTPLVSHRWSGCWGETPDRLPLVGRVGGRDGVWVAGGYSGHGNVLGLACGDLVARAILGEPPPELAIFDPARLL